MGDLNQVVNMLTTTTSAARRMRQTHQQQQQQFRSSNGGCCSNSASSSSSSAIASGYQSKLGVHGGSSSGERLPTSRAAELLVSSALRMQWPVDQRSIGTCDAASTCRDAVAI